MPVVFGYKDLEFYSTLWHKSPRLYNVLPERNKSLEPKHCEIKDSEDLKGKNTFLNFPVKKKKKKRKLYKKIILAITYHKGIKLKLCTFCELDKDLKDSRYYKNTILELIIKYIPWKWSLEKNSLDIKGMSSEIKLVLFLLWFCKICKKTCISLSSENIKLCGKKKVHKNTRLQTLYLFHSYLQWKPAK